MVVLFNFLGHGNSLLYLNYSADITSSIGFQKKSSVVLSWVVITAMWWAQSLFLVFVLLCMYITDTSLGWMVALACALIAFSKFDFFIFSIKDRLMVSQFYLK